MSTPATDLLGSNPNAQSPARQQQQINEVQRVAQLNRRQLTLFRVSPQPPRGVQFTSASLSWEAPHETRNITHYNVYAPDQNTLWQQVPKGQTVINGLLPDASQIWVSSFNQASGFASRQVPAQSVAALSGAASAPVVPPPAPAPNVTHLVLAPIIPGNPEVFYTDESGGQSYRIKGTFTLPADVSDYAGFRAIAQLPGDVSFTIFADTMDPTAVVFYSPWMPAPKVNQTWTVWVQPYNIATPSQLTPIDGSTATASVTVIKGTGSLDLGRTLASTYDTIELQVNPITGKFEVRQVNLQKVFNYNPAEFDPAGTFRIKGLSANKIITGTLFVGGGLVTPKPGQIFVADAAESLVAWIGQDATNTYFGGWFKELRVGGTDPSNSPFISDTAGNVTIKGGSIYLGPGGGNDGQMFIYNTSSVVGWIGSSGIYRGAWFQNLYIGGVDPGTAQIVSDSSGNITIKGQAIFNSTGSFLSGITMGGGFLYAYYPSGSQMIRIDPINQAMYLFTDGGGPSFLGGTAIALSSSLASFPATTVHGDLHVTLNGAIDGSLQVGSLRITTFNAGAVQPSGTSNAKIPFYNASNVLIGYAYLFN